MKAKRKKKRVPTVPLLEFINGKPKAILSKDEELSIKGVHIPIRRAKARKKYRTGDARTKEAMEFAAKERQRRFLQASFGD